MNVDLLQHFLLLLASDRLANNNINLYSKRTYNSNKNGTNYCGTGSAITGIENLTHYAGPMR